MNNLFSNFHINTEFYITMGVFFLITFIITIIIVFFISKINSLNSILYQAIEIDKAKIAKISALEKELEEAKLKVAELTRELQFLPKNKDRLKEAQEHIQELKEQLLLKTNENLKALHKQKIDFEQLNVHYQLLNKSYLKLEDKYNRLKNRNEILLKENAKLHTKIRENLVRISKQEKQNFET